MLPATPASAIEEMIRLADRNQYEAANLQLELQDLAGRLYPVAAKLTSRDFPSAIANLLAHGGNEDVYCASLLAGLWVEKDLEGARDWILGAKEHQRFARDLFQTWGRMDPDGMFDWLEKHSKQFKDDKDGWLGFDLVIGLNRSIGGTHPEQILKILTLTGQTSRQAEIFESWAVRSPAAAAARAAEEADELLRSQLITSVAHGWAKNNVDQAYQWAAALPDPIVSKNALLAIGGMVQLRGFRQSANYYAKMASVTREPLKPPISRWVKRDLPGALEWSAGLPDPSLREWVVSQMVNSGVSRDRLEGIDLPSVQGSAPPPVMDDLLAVLAGPAL